MESKKSADYGQCSLLLNTFGFSSVFTAVSFTPWLALCRDCSSTSEKAWGQWTTLQRRSSENKRCCLGDTSHNWCDNIIERKWHTHHNMLHAKDALMLMHQLIKADWAVGWLGSGEKALSVKKCKMSTIINISIKIVLQQYNFSNVTKKKNSDLTFLVCTLETGDTK